MFSGISAAYGFADTGVAPVAKPSGGAGTTAGWFASDIGYKVGSGGFGITVLDGGTSPGFALHGGVPIAFAAGKHYKFQLVPELNFGVSGGSRASAPVPGIVDVNASLLPPAFTSSPAPDIIADTPSGVSQTTARALVYSLGDSFTVSGTQDTSGNQSLDSHGARFSAPGGPVTRY